jgi:hypothetical protein
MLRYIGKRWLPGVPARDLTEDEVKTHGKARLLASGLYKEARGKPASNPTETAERAGKEPEEKTI